jgi:hypothetical protein
MDGLKERIGQIIGGAIGVVVLGGLFFAQCVYPLLRDTSETFTCDDKEMAEFCNDPATFAGFLAQVCGRGELVVDNTFIQTIGLGDPGVREPGEIEFTVKCGDVDLEYSLEEGDKIESFDDMRDAASNDRAKMALDLWEDWSLGLINYEDARRTLLAESR